MVIKHAGLEPIGPADSGVDDAGFLHDREARPPLERSDTITDVVINEKTFGIRIADTEEGRGAASFLINKRYAWRGYGAGHRVDAHPNRITLAATNGDFTAATVTVGLDSPSGLLADEIFRLEIDGLRAQGRQVCEVTKLAFDPAASSKSALASLFHIVFIYAKRINGCTDMVIEVNPRHRRFYESMLGFKRLGEMRTNPRVDAPAYLLWNTLDYIGEQIERFGGSSTHPGNERSLYPYFFSSKEEGGLANRLLNIG